MAIEFEDRSQPEPPEPEIPKWDMATQVVSVNIVDKEKGKVVLFVFNAPLFASLHSMGSAPRAMADLICLIAAGDPTVIESIQSRMNDILDEYVEEMDHKSDQSGNAENPSN